MVLTEMSRDLTAADLVDALADPHRCFQAYQRLLRLGPQASVAARRGLRHPCAQVREYSCMVLDHLMDADSVPLLISALDDPAERVRLAAAHALACDRCKEGVDGRDDEPGDREQYRRTDADDDRDRPLERPLARSATKKMTSRMARKPPTTPTTVSSLLAARPAVLARTILDSSADAVM